MACIPGKGGVKGRSGPPGNMDAFKHGLASIQKRREQDVPTELEENVRQLIIIEAFDAYPSFRQEWNGSRFQ